MTMNISNISNNINNSFDINVSEKSNDLDFSQLCDPIAQDIRKNVKDPIDREEDLRFWKIFSESMEFKKKNPNYDDFLDLKKKVMGFPPETASGRVRRAYREMMDRFPKDVRENIGAILNVTYDTFIRNKNFNVGDFGRILNEMGKYTGQVGDPVITDFNLINEVLGNLNNQISSDIKEDESVRQILI